MRGSISKPGATQRINGWLRAHPIRTPLIPVVIGIALLVLTQSYTTSVISARGRGIGGLIILEAVGGALLILGLLMLPLGVVIALKQVRNVVPLTCPSCGLTSAESKIPFRVDKVSGVEYSMVTCPKCRYDFTVDKYARLR